MTGWLWTHGNSPASPSQSTVTKGLSHCVQLLSISFNSFHPLTWNNIFIFFSSQQKSHVLWFLCLLLWWRHFQWGFSLPSCHVVQTLDVIWCHCFPIFQDVTFFNNNPLFSVIPWAHNYLLFFFARHEPVNFYFYLFSLLLVLGIEPRLRAC